MKILTLEANDEKLVLSKNKCKYDVDFKTYIVTNGSKQETSLKDALEYDYKGHPGTHLENDIEIYITANFDVIDEISDNFEKCDITISDNEIRGAYTIYKEMEFMDRYAAEDENETCVFSGHFFYNVIE